MALASAGKVPARGRKFVIFGFFFVVFCLDLGRDPTKLTTSEPCFLHQLAAILAPASTSCRPWFAPAVGLGLHQLSALVCTSCRPWFAPANEQRAVDHRPFNVGCETRSKPQ